MTFQTATNPETGETVVLVGNNWQKADQTASNDKGEKAFLVGGKWLTDTSIKPADASMSGVLAEGAKGLLRGASNTAMMIPHAIADTIPLAGPLIKQGVDAIAAPSRSLIQPNPQNNNEQMASTGGEIAGAALAGGPASSVRQTAINTLLPAAGGVLGEQLAGNTGKVVGALTPTAVQLTAGPILNKVGTAIADRVAPRMSAFKQAGTEPSVGQATELNFIQGFENLLSKFPGGQGVLRKFSEKQQSDLGKTASTGVSAEDAGRAIEQGITGFIGRSKEVWKKLDDAVAAKIPQGATFQPTNTVQALDTLTAPVAGAEKTTGALVNPKIAEIKQNISADLQANNGQMPFEAMRALRTKIGSMLDDSIVSGVPQGELKKLYGALSKDLEGAATQAGAGKEFARQNDFYRARMDRIEGTLDRVLGKTPEETFKRFMPTDANQVTTVRATMRSLDPEQRKVVQQAVVDRLGRANPGQQNEAGDVFSPNTFLTNWNKLSDGAKAQIFSDPAVRKNMDALGNVTENMRDGAKVFANPSGTAGAAAPLGLGYLMVKGGVHALAGDMGGAAMSLAQAGGLMGGATIGAKMLTSPKVVEWLAQYPKVSPEAAPLHLARLGVIFNETKDEKLKQELGDFIQSVK